MKTEYFKFLRLEKSSLDADYAKIREEHSDLNERCLLLESEIERIQKELVREQASAASLVNESEEKLKALRAEMDLKHAEAQTRYDNVSSELEKLGREKMLVEDQQKKVSTKIFLCFCYFLPNFQAM